MLTNALVIDFDSSFVLVDTEWIVHIATASFFHFVFMKQFSETSQLTSKIRFYAEAHFPLPGSFCLYLNRLFKRWKRGRVSPAPSLVCTASEVRYHLLPMLFLCETMKWKLNAGQRVVEVWRHSLGPARTKGFCPSFVPREHHLSSLCTLGIMPFSTALVDCPRWGSKAEMNWEGCKARRLHFS